jgi:hypothetical protein
LLFCNTFATLGALDVKAINSAQESTKWPRKVRFGLATVRIYRRKTTNGNFSYMVANYAGGKRRFDSYSTVDEALFAANRVAKQLSERDTVAASMTSGQASEYAVAVQTVKPLEVSLTTFVSTLAEAVKIAGDLPTVLTACKFFVARHKKTVQKSVAEVVAELLSVKQTQGASTRYIQDLKLRLNRFSEPTAR